MSPISEYCCCAAACVAARVVEVAEEADVLRQRDPIDRLLFVAKGGGHVAEGDLCLRHAVEPECVTGEELQRLPHLDRGELGPACREIEQPELDAGPGACFAFADRGADGELHCLHRGIGAPDQLPRVGDA